TVGAAGGNAFLLRLAADGSYLSSGTMYGSGTSYIEALAFDAKSRLYYGAPYSNNDIDPTADNSHHAIAAHSADPATCMLRADGKLVCVRAMYSTCCCTVVPRAFALISYSTIVVAGMFCGTADVDLGSSPTPFTSAGDADIFIAFTLQDGVFADDFE